MSDAEQVKRLEDRAWQAFAAHAGQRLTTFNFYIVLSSLLITAIAATFQKDFRLPYLGAVVGGLLAFVSYLFWRLDKRNRELIKLSESALKHFEAAIPPVDPSQPYHPAAFFSRDDYETAAKKAASKWYWRRHHSYANIFDRVYLIFALVGLVGAVLAICTARQH
jgi:hypothetical protein